MKLFRNKKTRLVALLSIVIATLSAALIISTVSWFSQSVPITPDEQIPSSILSRYFDMNDGADETEHPHGTAANPFVITRPVHYYNLVRLHELGTYGFDDTTTFQFGKTNLDGSGNTAPKFYSYSDDGVIIDGVYTTSLNMSYYSGSLALAPIGSARHPFEGHIIGNNLTVSNLHINGGGYSDIGIFGYVASHAVINELYFDSPYIDAANASAVAPSSLGHANHDTHVYIGYLAGHVYSPVVFTNVYLNNCHLFNTVGNDYEMINTYGFFGHTDQPLESTSDSSSYTSKLNATNAYNAVQYTYENGRTQNLSRRYTDEPASGQFGSAFSRNGSSGNYNYTITQKSSNKPYSLSSIGYSSGNNGTSRYVRYIKEEGGVNTLKTIEHVESENVLTDKPYDPVYGDFGGYSDGAYIYWDNANQKWIYAEVVGDTTRPINGSITLNCFTISYTQNDQKYYLKYQAGGTYATLVNEAWNSEDVPTAIDYYFCFKTSYGHTGVTRFTECSVDSEYYIYSPKGKKYLSTYSFQATAGNGCNDASVLHTPIFVSESGEGPNADHIHYPTKFTIGGPKTFITYTEPDNNSNSSNANTAFDLTTSTKKYKGVFQGPNLETDGLFGTHKMTAQCPGGEFVIGEYIDNQTTTLTNAVNFRLTSNSSDIADGSTLIIAGFDGEQDGTSSVDYAMAAQSSNNRAAKRVLEVRDGNNYVINDTTGLAKMTVHYVNGGNSGPFTLFCDGYIYWPGTPSKNYIGTKDVDDPADAYCQWTYEPVTCTGQYTKYRFKNVGTATDYNDGDNTRYLCYNNNSSGSKLFSTYKKSVLKTHWNTDYIDDPNLTPQIISTYPEGHAKEGQIITNTSKWFYIYKQQTGQTISNVHYTTSVSFDIDSAPVYPYKTITPYDLKSAAINAVPTNISAYSNFTVDPSHNVSFDAVQSQVHFYETLIETWKRVNIVSELEDGDQVVIAAKTSGTTHYFMSTTQNNNNRGRTSNVSFTPPYLAGGKLPNAAQRFTLEKSGSYWRFNTGSGYIYGVSGQNYLRTETTPDANHYADFTISVSLEANSTITSVGSGRKIQYTSSGWSGYFSCFNSTQTQVQIYKLDSSTADQTTWVGDLINDFEPDRMDAVGPNITYYSTYMKVNSSPSIINTPTNDAVFYPSKYLSNTISLMIDNNGSKDLGTLIIDCDYSGSNKPYFMPSNTNIVTAGAVDTDSVGNDSRHIWLLNINAMNISGLSWLCLKGAGTKASPYQVCSSSDPDMTKYVVLLGFASDIQINDITFTFNAVPGNIGYAGTVDYRSASYDANGAFNGSVAGGQQVSFSAISIYYDVTNTGQKVHIYVNYTNGVYTVTVDTQGTVLTQPLIINIFKYDNSATSLIVIVNGNQYGNGPIYYGTTSITVPANSSP